MAMLIGAMGSGHLPPEYRNMQLIRFSAIGEFLMAPPLRRRCGFLKFFLFASIPLGLFPGFSYLPEIMDGGHALGWIFSALLWLLIAHLGFYLTAASVQLCLEVRSKEACSRDMEDCTKNLRESRIGTWILYVYENCFFQVLVRILAWITYLSGSFLYFGCAIAITVLCIICLCFHHDASGVTQLIFKTYAEMVVGQLIAVSFFSGTSMLYHVAPTCLVLFTAAAAILHRIGQDSRMIQEFLELRNKAKLAASEAMDAEAATLGEIPDEFLDPIQGDPFNCSHLTQDMLIPDGELKARIEEFIMGLKAKERAKQGSNGNRNR